jgi:hypothetical protein
MPKSKIILALGCMIALLPFLGFPHSWESFLEVVGGLSIVSLSVLISIDRRLSLKAKMQKRQARKRALVDVHSENLEMNSSNLGSDNTVNNNQSGIQ